MDSLNNTDESQNKCAEKRTVVQECTRQDSTGTDSRKRKLIFSDRKQASGQEGQSEGSRCVPLVGMHARADTTRNSAERTKAAQPCPTGCWSGQPAPSPATLPEPSGDSIEVPPKTKNRITMK